METQMNNLGERIIELLKESGMTQKVFADYIGITEASLSRYINGERKPKAEIVANMATALHTTSDYILGVEEKDEMSGPQITRLLARNVNRLSREERNKIIKLLLDSK
jgi:transcriptional regulator with XRE-family HTH domain